MKEQLISLSKQKGFKGGKYYTPQTPNTPEIIKNAQGLEDYLWMCELQKWLRDMHKINIVALPYTASIEDRSIVYIWMISGMKSSTAVKKEHYKLFEDALESGLQEALKLIKR